MRFIRLPKDRIVWLLLLVSLILYLADYLLFPRAAEIGFNFMSNVAFLPVYVLFVTLMIERVLKEREREAMMKKLNMVIGIFFSEVGSTLLHDLKHFYAEGHELTTKLLVTVHWREEDFLSAREFVKTHDVVLDARVGDLAALKQLLCDKKGVMLSLMENPNLLEHGDFTDLLWAVFHLIEELQARKSLDGLPQSDMEHLGVDMKRAHSHLLLEWLSYMEHLQKDYPYLFSLAVRMNPMNPQAHPEVV